MNQKYIIVISCAAIIIAVVGIAYQYMSSLHEQTIQNQPVPVELTQNTTNEVLSSILPVREDIGTTWKIFPVNMQPLDLKSPPEVNLKSLPSTEQLAQLKSDLESASGYRDGITQMFWKNLEGQDFLVNVWAFKFNSSENAWIQYNKTIT